MRKEFNNVLGLLGSLILLMLSPMIKTGLAGDNGGFAGDSIRIFYDIDRGMSYWIFKYVINFISFIGLVSSIYFSLILIIIGVRSNRSKPDNSSDT